MKKITYLKYFCQEYKSNFVNNLSKFSLTIFFISMFLSLIGAGLISGYFEVMNVTKGVEKYKFYPTLICFIVFISYLIYILYKSCPNIYKFNNENSLSLSDIQKLPFNIKKIGVIGISSVGKSSFINNIFHERFSNYRTQNIIGRILNNRLCFIDLDGASEVDLYNVLKLSEFIIIIIDHNSSDSPYISKQRYETHKDFINKISNVVKVYDESKNKPSIFLVNKMDLWEKSKKSDSFEKNANELYEIWKTVYDEQSVKYNFSNSNAFHNADKTISDILNLIKNLNNSGK